MATTPIKINAKTFAEIGINAPTKIDFNIKRIAKGGEAAEAGNVPNHKVVNISLTVTMTWDTLTVAEMELLCAEVGIIIPDLGVAYPVSDLTDNDGSVRLDITTPAGARALTMYLDDSMQAELRGIGDPGGTEWKDFSLKFIDTAVRA